MEQKSANNSHAPILLGTAVFGISWVIARACMQSITIDEADTYLT